VTRARGKPSSAGALHMVCCVLPGIRAGQSSRAKDIPPAVVWRPPSPFTRELGENAQDLLLNFGELMLGPFDFADFLFELFEQDGFFKTVAND
jgi:hypothetical protein